MNPRRSRWLLRLAIVPVIALLALFWAVRQQTHSLTIENRSEQSIDELNVSIGGQTQKFQNVKAGDRVTAQCPARGEDRFTVEGKLANDTRIRLSGLIRDSLDFVLLPNGTLEEHRKDSR
jgi:hypothetical protein